MPKLRAKAKPVPKGYSNALDLQQMPSLSMAFGQTKSLCHFRQDFFLCLTKWSFFFFLWGGFFNFFTQGLFSAFYFSIGLTRKELPRGNFCQVCDVNKSMQLTWNTSDESHPLTRLWHLRSLLTLFENTFFLNNSAAFWDF